MMASSGFVPGPIVNPDHPLSALCLVYAALQYPQHDGSISADDLRLARARPFEYGYLAFLASRHRAIDPLVGGDLWNAIQDAATRHALEMSRSRAQEVLEYLERRRGIPATAVAITYQHVQLATDLLEARFEEMLGNLIEDARATVGK